MDEILDLKGIYKSFGDVEVLKDINFSVKKGEVRGLIGANGAGKSTMIKVIGGVHQQTKGEILLKGVPIKFKDPHHSMESGISVIYQELSLVPTLTVIENMFLGREETKGKQILDKRAMESKYREICNKFDFDIDPNIRVSNLNIANRQMVEIMKAVSYDSDIIIMDEPTTSLTSNEKESLFKIIKMLKSMDKTIIYISHILDEIFLNCDNVSIMRNGVIVGTYDKKDLDKRKIAELMTGKEQLNIKEKKVSSFANYSEPPILQVENLSRKNVLKDVSFEVYRGEVVGLAGLVGSGRTEIINILYGLDKKDSGDVRLNGKIVNISSPKIAIKNKIGLIPEDRKDLGLILGQEVYKNSTAIQIDKMKSNGFINTNKEIDFAEEAVDQLSIKVNNVGQKVKELSGGNQQKVVVSKWLGQDLDLIIYDEPTKGIDISAKEDIFRNIEDLSEKGIGVIFISSDIEEVIRISDRVLVVRDGTIIDTMKNDNITVQDIMNKIFNVE